MISQLSQSSVPHFSGDRARRAILLLAGRGRRLGELTADRPKCLLPVEDKPILIHSLDALAECGFREAILVVGYRSSLVHDLVGEDYRGLRITYVSNHEYEDTNTAHSLWLARDHFDEALLLLEGDIVFDSATLNRMLNGSASSSVWLTVPVGPDRDEGILLAVSSDNQVRSVGLFRNPEDRLPEFTHKCAGLQLLSREMAVAMACVLSSAASDGERKLFADLALGRLIPQKSMRSEEVAGGLWAEIDDADDLEAATRLFRTSAGCGVGGGRPSR